MRCDMKKRIFSVMLIFVLLAEMMLLSGTAAAADVEQTAVAYMNITFECGCTRVGTGTMIAVNGMVTAAHNLVCYQHNKHLKSCVLYFGRRNNQYHYKYDGTLSYAWFADFSNGYVSSDDIGYIVFPNDIGNTTGWYGWSAESDDDIRWEYCHMTGYDGGVTRDDWAQVDVYNTKEITWPISSGFRNSSQGGPVYYAYEGLEYPVLVAVYTTCGTSTGYARRLTSAVIEDMKKNGVKFN